MYVNIAEYLKYNIHSDLYVNQQELTTGKQEQVLFLIEPTSFNVILSALIQNNMVLNKITMVWGIDQ